MIKYQPTAYPNKYAPAAHHKYNSRNEFNDTFHRSKIENNCNFNTIGQTQLTIEQRILARQRVQSKLNLHKQNKENQVLKNKYRNAQKLKRFEQLKQSNIDDLNCKIKKMITKLAIEDNQNKPSAKVEELKERRRHERFKTDYENFNSNSREEEIFGKLNSQCQQKSMIESEIIQNIAETPNFQKNSKKRIQNNNVEQIRRKYKDGDSQCREIKGGSSKDSFGANSKANDTFRSGNGTLNADLIRFRQKIKENNERQRRQLSNELEFQYRQTLKKDDSLNRLQIVKRKNIDEDFIRYNKRIENYNSKKMVTLPDQELYERMPLREATTRFNNQFTFVPFQIKKMDEKKLNQTQFLHPKIKLKLRSNKQKLSVDESEPLTADFRYKEEQTTSELRLLLENLMNQVKLDETFRKGKKWFEKQAYSLKWKRLQECLESKKVNLDESSIRQIFSPAEEQDDPFYSPRQTQFSVESLAAAFVQCESNWFQNVIKKYNRQKLVREGFVSNKIDCSGKGYLEIEDIVRFINLQMDAEIRNRDVFLVFERLKSEEQLTFQDVIQVICY